jgi:outer membrane protein
VCKPPPIKLILEKKYKAMKLLKVFLSLSILCLAAISVKAQSAPLKIGYTNVDYILSKLPEAKQIESELKTHEEQLGAQLQAKMKEFEGKYKTFMETQESLTPVIRNDKQNELQTLQTNIQKFQQEAEKSLQQKQVELLKPAYDKIQSSIDQVAKENGFTHIFSNDAGGVPILLYATEQDDISNLVLVNLGVTTSE